MVRQNDKRFHDLYHHGAPEDIVGTDRESGTPILACIACRTVLKKPWPGMTRLSSYYLQDDQVIESLLLIEHGSPA